MLLKKIGCLKKNCSARYRKVLPFSWFGAKYLIWAYGGTSNLTFAAMDTTSNALARVLHLLSTHPDVQSKLRQEIVDARS